MDIVVCLATALVAYLLGSIPSGYLAGRAKGIDIRSVGSGNIGATNVFRILGKPAGIIVLVVDGLKGWVSVALVPDLVVRLLAPGHWSESGSEYLKIIAGMSAILGHNYTCWLKFKGGKGIATSAGVVAALIPQAFVIAVIVWVVVCLLTRYVSVASITAAAVLPLATWAVHQSPRMIVIAAVMAALAIYKHKANIQRLMQGTENKIGAKKTPPPTGAGS
ncbi:MAG: putative rane protein [Pedosphaera sp.]|nr:putative rane protein [Pedosphaera sp.]